MMLNGYQKARFDMACWNEAVADENFYGKQEQRAMKLMMR